MADETDETSAVVPTLDDDTYELIVFFEQAYLLNGMIPSMEACEASGFPNALYNRALKNKTFRRALSARGVDLGPLKAVPGAANLPRQGSGASLGALTEQQLLLANTLLDLNDGRSRKKKMQDLKIPTSTYQAWLRDPAFQQYLRQRSENLLGDNQHEAHLALIDRVSSGDINAIKYFNEITGRFTPASAKGGTTLDTAQLLTFVIEVIQRHVKDGPTQEKIANDLLGLAMTARLEQQANTTPVGGLPAITSAPIGL
jgi:Helix-turn-helix of insertion element transposase